MQIDKIHTSELTKKDWLKLNELGIVNGDGNGFANTTKMTDEIVKISVHRDTIIKLQKSNVLYKVRYYSGCFYPLWYKVKHITGNPEIGYFYEFKDAKFLYNENIEDFNTLWKL